MISTKQKRARQRNWTKLQLAGALTTFENLTHSNLVTNVEIKHLILINKLLKTTLKNWDDGNKEILNKE